MKRNRQRLEVVKIQIISHPLLFKQPAMTSRDVLTTKPTFFLVADDREGRRGIGECSLIPGLSLESEKEAANALHQISFSKVLDPETVPDHCPSVRFAVEMALMDLATGGQQMLFDSDFSRGDDAILINGLIWMNTPAHMMEQATQLLQRGFKTLKMKIGTRPFLEELAGLKALRDLAPMSEGFTLRVDANGAFSKRDGNWTPKQKLTELAGLGIHSIEQPLMPSDGKGLAELCANSPIPIALDESLIGVNGENRLRLLEEIRPQYIIVKPSLVGGLAWAEAWVDCAESLGIGWWATSALESNIGLNAIAQWTAHKLADVSSPLPQGLGTGGLFTNNIASPLRIDGEHLRNQRDGQWSWPKSFPR